MLETTRHGASNARAMLAVSTLHAWLLWGGLCLLFLIAYVGIYVWMRRPDFGEGNRRRRSTTPSAPGESVEPTPPHVPSDSSV